METLLALKGAKTKHNVSLSIKQRWSPRTFSIELLSDDEIHALFEAASWAPSGGNGQPWSFVYAKRGSEQFATMLECLNPTNQVWAQHAAVLVLALAQTERTPGKVNRLALYDTGSAVTTLLLQAVTMGIYGRQMGGYNMQKTLENFHIPQGIEPAVFFALGRLGDPNVLPSDEMRERELQPRMRKPLEEFVFTSSPFADK